MASEATFGYGTRLYVSDSDLTTFATVIGQIKDVPFPEWECEDVDITNQDSPDATKEYIAGFSDGGDIEVEMIFKSSVRTTIESLYRLKRNFRVCMPKRNTSSAEFTGTPPDSTPRFEFLGYIKKLGGTAPVEDAIMGTITIKVSSKPTFTAEP